MLSSEVRAAAPVFAALGDETRLRLVLRLCHSGRQSSTLLSERLPITRQAVTKHLRVLTRAGLISQGRDRQFRPCRIEPAPLKQAADWALQYRALWEGNLDRLGAYLQALQGNRKAASASSRASRTRRRIRKD